MKKSILTAILVILIASGMITVDIWAEESVAVDGESSGTSVYETETEMYGESDAAGAEISTEVQEENF